MTLYWTPVTQLQNGSPARDLAGYLIYRRSGDSAWIKLRPEPVAQNAYQDVAVLNEVEYTYKVQAVRRLGDRVAGQPGFPASDRQAGEADAAAAPVGPLRGGHLSGRGTALGNQPGPDLAGYRVYRRGPGEESRPLTPSC